MTINLSATGPVATSATPQFEALLSELAGILNVETLDPDAPLIEIGVDSINIVEIMLCCERIYGISTLGGEIQLDQYTTICDIDRQAKALLLETPA